MYCRVHDDRGSSRLTHLAGTWRALPFCDNRVKERLLACVWD